MANLNERLPENAPGAWYVTTECIDCDLCRETAPTVFRRADEIGFSIVFHQPESETEKAQSLEALKDCPVEAIGNDDLASQSRLVFDAPGNCVTP